MREEMRAEARKEAERRIRMAKLGEENLIFNRKLLEERTKKEEVEQEQNDALLEYALEVERRQIMREEAKRV